jgi:hypothetical protein
MNAGPRGRLAADLTLHCHALFFELGRDALLLKS